MNKPVIPLVADLTQLIDAARTRTAVAVNAEITLLYWQVGERINKDVLKGQRADYGKQVMAELAIELAARYGRGWSNRNLANMCLFAKYYPDNSIVQTLSAQLSWSHFVLLLTQSDELKHSFYAELAA